MAEQQRRHFGCNVTEDDIRLSFVGNDEEPMTVTIPINHEKEDCAVAGACEPEQVQAFVLTAKDPDSDITVECVEKIQNAGIPESVIYVQDYLESFVHFVVHQEPELWNHAVVLFTLEQGVLKSYEMIMKRQTRPYLVQVYPGPVKVFDGNDGMDEAFAELAMNYFRKKLVSSVFLSGEEFEGNWMKRSLKVLCAGRRVFQGKNLFSKGACYAALDFTMEKRGSGGGEVPFIYLGERNTKSFIGILTEARIGKECREVMSAGLFWRTCRVVCEVMADDTEEIGLVVQSAYTGESRQEVIPIPGLPRRPKRTTRLKITFTCKNVRCCHVLVEDIGFGEFFSPSGLSWEKDIPI
nr:DUF5716 family protein [Diplocloster modestus]